MQSGAFHKPFVLSLIFSFAIAHCAFAANRLVINEVMINEPGSETSLEWVELFNAAEDSINLNDYIFIEAADTTRFASHWLPTHAFVVLSRKPFSTDISASFERRWGNASNLWGDDSLENYLLLPAKMSLRNSNDSITIVELSSGTAETAKWGSTPPDGVSLERVNPMTLAAAKNFKYCKSPTLSTPGRINSVIAKMRDWGFIEDDCEIFVPPDSVHPIQFQLTVGNFGQTDAASLFCDVLFDRDFTGTLTDRDSLFQFQLDSLLPDSTLTVTLDLDAKAGRHAFIFQLAPDDDTASNTIRFECLVGPLSREMLITEFVPSAGSSTGCEWIELQSVVNYDLSLQGWTLATDDSEISLDGALQIRPSDKIILCEDSICFRYAFSNIECQVLQPSTWHPLANASGAIVLRMHLAAISDSVSYRGSIDPGRSWERDLDSNSTIFESQFYRSTAILGSTPCGDNSIRPVPVAVDLAFVSESLVLTRDSLDDSQIFARVMVVNNGYQTSPSLAIRVFEDSNRDSVAQESELILHHDSSALAAGDTASFEIAISLDAGRHTFIFALPDDEVPLNTTVAATITVGPITHELLITEFIANPEATLESEWIEIQNVSEYPVNLQGWTFGDASHQSLLDHAVIVQPGEYHVLAQNPAAFAEYYGGTCAPLSCKTWSNLNNSGDIIIARDEFGTLSDSVCFVHVADSNRSMERAPQPVPGLPDWNPSVALSGSTPCAANSLQPAPLAVDIGFLTESFRMERDSLDVSVVLVRFNLKNFGYQTSPHAAVDIFDDRNRGGSPTADEFLATITSVPISPGDTCAIFHSFHFPLGRHALILQLPDDDDPSNNLISATITTGSLTRELIITEFLADPAAPLETEWIELRNIANYPVNIANWRCGDRSSSQQLDYPILVPSGVYFVIAQDSAAFAQFYGEGCLVVSPKSWSSLNNSGDIIILRDEFGTISDSLTFFECAGNNRSIERNESGDLAIASWYPSTSQPGSTPCAVNSVSGNYSGNTSITLLNRVFSPLAGEELRFNLQCPPASIFTIEIFDLSGRRQRVIADGQYFSSGEFSYDGASDHSGRLSIGAYILKIESENGDFSQKVGFAIAPPK